MNSYKIMKVFDCQDMPEDVKKIFFEIFNDPSKPNDCYVDWTVHDSTEEFYLSEEGAWSKIIDDWLIANGADPGKKGESFGEEVLINHWW